MCPRKKTNLEESLARSHAYNPIRDFQQDSWQDSRPDCWQDFSRQKVSPRVSDRIIYMTPGETLSETRFFYAGDYSVNFIQYKLERIIYYK